MAPASRGGAPRTKASSRLRLRWAPFRRAGRLDPIEYALGGPNDHAKGALLLSGLFASGPTTILEPIVSRDHTERLLDALGMPVKAAGSMISLHPPADPFADSRFRDLDVPGDISAAIFILVAAQIVPGSNVNTRRTGLNPTRSAALEVIRLSGGSTGISPAGNSLGEALSAISRLGARACGIALDGELLEALARRAPGAARPLGAPAA